MKSLNTCIFSEADNLVSCATEQWDQTTLLRVFFTINLKGAQNVNRLSLLSNQLKFKLLE